MGEHLADSVMSKFGVKLGLLIFMTWKYVLGFWQTVSNVI